LHILRGHTNAIRCVAYHPAGEMLASSSYDHTLRLWDTQSGQLLYTVPTQNTTALSIAFHPEGALLALGTNQHTIQLWDTSTWRLLTMLRDHSNSVESVCFSADGQWLFSASGDETVKIWDVAAALNSSDDRHQEGVDACRQTLQTDGPYAGMNITGVTGISMAQKMTLKTLGAVEI